MTNLIVVQRVFSRIALIGYQTIAFILSFFRNVVSEYNQIDSLKNAQDDPNLTTSFIVQLKFSMRKTFTEKIFPRKYKVIKQISSLSTNLRSSSQCS